MNTKHSIPTIDASRLTDRETAREIDRACRDWGAFHLVEHGLDVELVESLRREMRAFFALPAEVKCRVERSAENPWGFFDRELTGNSLDQKEIFDCGPDGDEAQPTPWPEASPGFRSAMERYMNACEGLAFRLLGAIALGLGAPASQLEAAFRPRHSSFLRLNHYPVGSSPDCAGGRHLGVHRHTDSGALTLLLQDEVPGLEVLRDGRWHLVEPRPDALVVNIGDVVQVWSNDRYPAAVHRVRAIGEKERYSAPFFFNPSYESRYAPLPTTVGEGSPARYQSIQWREFRALRAAGDYQDCGEEVQIHHYRIGGAERDAEMASA